jgi:hypothetical protein
VNKSFKCEKLTERRNGIQKIIENHGNSDKNTAFVKKTRKTRQMTKNTENTASVFTTASKCELVFRPQIIPPELNIIEVTRTEADLETYQLISAVL